jgi:hypothetical protein
MSWPSSEVARVRFMVGKVALGQFNLQILQLSAVTCHSTNAPDSSVVTSLHVGLLTKQQERTVSSDAWYKRQILSLKFILQFLVAQKERLNSPYNTPWPHRRGVQVSFYSFFTLGHKGVGVEHHGLGCYSRYPLYRSWEGPRASLIGYGKPRPARIRSLDLSARSKSLYRLLCPDPKWRRSER